MALIFWPVKEGDLKGQVVMFSVGDTVPAEVLTESLYSIIMSTSLSDSMIKKRHKLIVEFLQQNFFLRNGDFWRA